MPTTEEIEAELDRRGHIVTSWDDLGSITPSNGIETSQYRIGRPSEDTSPTVFKATFPPNCRVEAHTHGCDYSEIILKGSQKVSGKWLHEGDIRIGLANKGYGPLIAGPEGRHRAGDLRGRQLAPSHDRRRRRKHTWQR